MNKARWRVFGAVNNRRRHGRPTATLECALPTIHGNSEFFVSMSWLTLGSTLYNLHFDCNKVNILFL